MAQATAQLNARNQGTVVAACNGLFFDVDTSVNPPNGVAHHVAATVEDGVVRHNVGNYRWTFGERSGLFDALYLPDRPTMTRSFTYASGGAQCLIKDGQPLRLAPFPSAVAPAERGPIPSTPLEVGHIPVVDHIKTSRVSFGWSRDSKQLYLLFVRQSGTEEASIGAFQVRGDGFSVDARSRMTAQGGWDLADEQQFWRRFGVWGAVNSDGGEVAQLSLIDPGGRYTVFPAKWATSTEEFDNVDLSTLSNASTLPAGGSLMYFYVYDSSGGSSKSSTAPPRTSADTALTVLQPKPRR